MSSSFRKLEVYQHALDALVSVNRLCLRLPRDFMFVAWQARRAASSVVLNMAEGAGEDRPLEKARMYRLARRLAWETQTALNIGVRLELFDPRDVAIIDAELDRVCAMLWTMTARCEARAVEGRRPKRQRWPKRICQQERHTVPAPDPEGRIDEPDRQQRPHTSS